MGVLAAPAGKVRMSLPVTRDSVAGPAVVMTSLDQGNAKIPGRLVTRGDALVVSMPAIPASYTAILTPVADSLLGSFAQGISTYPLNMVRARGGRAFPSYRAGYRA